MIVAFAGDHTPVKKVMVRVNPNVTIKNDLARLIRTSLNQSLANHKLIMSD
ncbi:hypothetical protein [Shouchella lehensis]|uniref:Uncharacterized protein n=1 Tax=Shouchella lehensis G1 TaxID=1246626 RepID=A0A060LV27_9BACI|nr:hypothetical protein [Shouchella lehensis]AIC93640.1 hypothetical protein BleG1_1037 [Shouchella lehensis G1]